MPTEFDEDDEGETELEEWEAPDPQDADWNLDPATDTCPYCREEISEDATRCPNCGNYISAEDAPPMRRSTWYVFIALFLILLFAVGYYFWG